MPHPLKDKINRIYLSFLLALLLAFSANGATLSSQTMFSPHGDVVPLIPFLDYRIDESLTWDIDEAASPARANTYKPFVLNDLPREEGVVWLRFILSPAPSTARGATYLLDMGPGVPGTPVLYEPRRNELSGAMEWNESTPGHRDILLLPEQGADSLVCYIRLEGLPGPWFSPTIRSPQNAASNLGGMSRTGAILALAVVMLLCVLRGLGENGQWRFWIALFVGAGLAQALLGMPRVEEGFSILNLFAILLPGLALMILAHAGRHLMGARTKSRSIDIQLLLLSLAGAILALLPLAPGFKWLERWLDLWPAGAILFVPTATAAWIMGISGSRRFLLACLLPPVFVTAAILGLDFGIPPNFLASLPLWGVVASALLLAASKSPVSIQENVKKTQQKIVSPSIEMGEPIINLNHPLDDPNLRIIQTDDPVASTQPEKVAESLSKVEKLTEFEKKEEALRLPLDEIIRQSAALGNCSLPAAAREYAEKILLASEKMASVISGDLLPEDPTEDGGEENFNLQRILRNAHDATAPLAEHAGLALSWHLPPHLGLDFRGNSKKLEEVLILLLESSIRGTSHGAIHLSARRVPESADPGHILFSITDNGEGTPPLNRSGIALLKAWELAAKYDGFLELDSTSKGQTIAFSMHLRAATEEENGERPLPHVIAASDDSTELQKMAEILESLPCRVTKASSLNEILVAQRMDAAPLLIAHGKFALPAAGDAVREFVNLAEIAGYARGHALAITRDDSTWPLLKPSGFTHAMIEPVDAGLLLETITNLIEISGTATQLQVQENSGLIDLVDAFYAKTVELGENPNPGEQAEKVTGPLVLNLDENEGENTAKGQTESERADTSSSIPLEGEQGKPDTEAPQSSSEKPEVQESEIDLKVEQPEAEKTSEVKKANFNEPENFEGPDWLLPELPEQGKRKNGKETRPSADAFPDAMPNLEMVDPVPQTEILTMAEAGSGESDHDEISEPAKSSAAEDKESVKGPEESIVDFIMDAIAQEVPSLKQKPETKTVNNPRQDPIVTALVERLEEAMASANAAFAKKDAQEVASAIGRLARQAESFGGLRQLTRMAQTVERAAKANDMAALGDLLPELANAVERNRIALTQ